MSGEDLTVGDVLALVAAIDKTLLALVLGGIDGPPPTADMVRDRLEALRTNEPGLRALAIALLELRSARHVLARQPVTVGTKRGRFA